MLIGISGKIGAGKDEVGKIIQILTTKPYPDPNYSFNESILKSEWEIKKFADTLKDILCSLLNCTRELLENRQFKEAELGEEWWYWKLPTGEMLPYNDGLKFQFSTIEIIKLTPRIMLQLLGTEAGRSIIHPNIWVNALFSKYIKTIKIESATAPLEFPKWIITDVRFENEADEIINRGGIMIRVNRDICNSGEHKSETALDNYTNFKYVIDNNSSLLDLQSKVLGILKQENIL